MSGACQFTQPLASDRETRLEAGRTIIGANGYPFSVFAWFNTAGIGTEGGCIIDFEHNPTGAGYSKLKANHDRTVTMQTGAPGFSFKDATSVSLFSLNTWQTAGGVAASADSLKVYLNGALETTVATHSLSQGTIDNCFIGAAPTSTVTEYFQGYSGCLAHVTAWNVALSDSDMANLNAGRNPLTIQPGAIVLYAPLADQATVTNTFLYSVSGGTVIGGPPLTLFTADGGTLTTCGSAPTVDAPPSTIYYNIPILIGCPYTSKAQLLRPDFGESQGRDIGALDGPAFARKRRIHQFGISLYRTRDISLGTDLSKTLYPLKLQTYESGPDIGKTALFSGTIQDSAPDDWGRTSQLTWEQDRPTPGTILAIGGFVQSSGK